MSTPTIPNARSRWDIPTILIAGLAVVSLALTGCGDTEAESGAQSSVAPRVAATTAGVPSPPTLEELQTTLQLTAEQTAALSSPLSEWHASVADAQARRAERRARHQQGQRPSDGGARKERAAARTGEGRESPMLTFVAESATVLEHDQYVQLISYLGERREAHRGSFDRSDSGERRGRGGRGGRGGPGMGMMRELDLTADQQEQLRDAMGSMRDATRDARQAHAAGTITDEALRDRMAESRQAIEATLAGILTEEQLARREELKTERRQQMAERRLQRLDDRVDSRVEHLTALVQLTDAQQAEVRDIMNSFEPRSRALITGLGSGETTPEDAHYEMKQIREETTAAVRAALTPEQIEIFDALETLGRGRGPGPGHRGPRF